MRIYQTNEKRKYLNLLLLADEQESMIEKYLDQSDVFVLDDDGVKGEITVCQAGNGVIEIKNLAVLPNFQKRGYGRALINFVCEKYAGQFHVMQVGTGDSPLTVPFYEKCGFVKFRTVKNFFIDNYDHPIYECGRQLVDMIYLKKQI